jgi:two-component system, OmpR family, phosphate regulon response regulator PhoB
VRQGSILVVEDDPTVRELLVSVLTDCRYAVMDVADGREAIDTIRHHSPAAERFSLVLLDLMLPGLDGLELMSVLADELHDVPVVAMSASYTHLAAAPDAGAVATIAKPFDLRYVLDVVAEYAAPRESYAEPWWCPTIGA